MEECLFCKFVNSEIKIKKIFENKNIIAFNDINPQAPIHILIIPKLHISTLNELKKDNVFLLGEMVFVASLIAKQKGIEDVGYRTVFNCNQDGGQTIFHIHLHLLAGRQMQWPPG